MRLLHLPIEVQHLIETDQLSTGHAKVILGISSPSEQQRIAQLVVSKNLSVRETEKILESTVITRKRSTKDLRRSPLSDVEERLQKRLGTKVTILNGRRGGKVIIHYFSPAELDGILENLLQ